MYLDTKNLTASHNNTSTTTAITSPSNKPGRRMRKVWQPLRRLLAVGGKGRPSQLNLVHPNNVDLNNTQPQLELPSILATEDDSKSALEESVDKSAEEVIELTPPPNTPTLISSVYVEKASPQSSGACQHGRNCQHTHHQNNNSATQVPSTLWDLQFPLQYISTDNGTFFWTNTQERVDDDLLHAWLCQSFSQLPGTLC